MRWHQHSGTQPHSRPRGLCSRVSKDAAIGHHSRVVRVEILYFEGCPNLEGARALVKRVAQDHGVVAEVAMVKVPDAESAIRQRFLGSPSVRVEGADVEPNADERTEFALGCRVYRTDSGPAGQPSEEWVRAALLAGDER